MPFKVLISDSLSKEALEILEKEKEFRVEVNTKLTPDEIDGFVKKAYQSFYFLPKYILKRILQLKSPQEFFQKSLASLKLLKI